MPRLIVKKWREFQHYKDRSPPWIKLQKSLLDDYDFHRLPLASKALAPLIWLLASESEDGSIDSDAVKIAFRIRWDIKDVSSGLKSLIIGGFLIDASNALANCKQDACLETETETEGEAEESAAKPRPLRKCPTSFIVTQTLLDWAGEKAPGVDVTSATEAFRDHTFNRGITDWPGAWRNWMRREMKFVGKRRKSRYDELMEQRTDPAPMSDAGKFLLGQS